MNKKLFFGVLLLASIATVLIACGKGTVDPFGSDDDIAALYSLDAQKSLDACEADLECSALLNQATTPSSSSTYIPPSSSSEDPFLPSSSSSIVPLSSSSLIVIVSSSSVIAPSSSSIIVVSSSSIVPEGGIEGTCAPTPATADLGQTVTWTFTKGASVPVQQIISADFDWVFEGGSLGEFSGKGVSGISKSLTYSVSGPHTTSLSINGSAPIACTPVQVNGAKITGCACTVDEPSPDVIKDAVSTWTVAGCASTANITGYTWNTGTIGEELTFSHLFTAKDEVFTPTLRVSNDDNTVKTVTCPSAKAVDSSLPDYVLDGTAAGTYTLGAGTYSMQYACPTANQYYQPPINISASGGWDAFDVTYSTKTTPAGSSLNSQQHNIEFASLFGSWSGALPTEMVSITVNHAVVIKCQ